MSGLFQDNPDEIDSRGAEHRYTTYQIFTEWVHRALVGVIGLLVLYSHYTAWSLKETIGSRPYKIHFVASTFLIFQAVLGTTTAVFLAAAANYMLDTDFGFLGLFLFIALAALVVMRILNLFIYKSNNLRMLSAYAGVVIFTLYLLFDLNTLEKRIEMGDESWGTAIRVSVNLYLDIINLFLDLLKILAEGG